MYYIGLDIGTFYTKGLLVDNDGRQLASSAIPHGVESIKAGWAEQDAEKIWWEQTVQVMQSLLQASTTTADEIGGLCISGLFPALLIADEYGRPLRPAILYSDNRAGEELSRLNQSLGLELNGDSILPKLEWIRIHEPEIYIRIAYLFSAHNYIVYKLTGSYCLDYKVASSLGGFLDPNQLGWNPLLTEWTGLGQHHLPNLASPSAIAGRVTEEAARVTGLPEGMPVVAGSGDSLLAILGAGVIHRGESLVSFGTTGWLAVLPQDLDTYLHDPIRAPYKLETYLLSLGSTLTWLVQNFDFSEWNTSKDSKQISFQALDNAASHLTLGCDGLFILPYFQGNRSAGGKEPLSGSICGLSMAHTPLHIYRAFMESFGYAIRSDLERLKEDGIDSQELVCTGSGAKSELWIQIVSDITGRKCRAYPQLDACLGNAFLASYSLGHHHSLSDILAWLPPARKAYPGAEKGIIYDGAYQNFLRLRSTLSS
jgi:xylulokinase